MTDSEKEMTNLARCLSRNLFVCMGYKKPIKNTELAEMSGVSVAAISRIKNDWQGKERVHLETVVKLASALDVETVDLLSKDSIFKKLEGTA